MLKTPRTSKKLISTKPPKTIPTNKLWDIADDILPTHEAFVYIIENKLTGRKYIGRKYLWSVLTRPPLKGYKRRRRVKKESDWRTYTGSCPELNADIETLGIDNFSFKVLHVTKTRSEANYLEVKEQFLHDVLYAKNEDGQYIFYNTNIGSHYYRGRAFVS